MMTIQEREITIQIEQQKPAAEEKREAKARKLEKRTISAQRVVEQQKIAAGGGNPLGNLRTGTVVVVVVVVKVYK